MRIAIVSLFMINHAQASPCQIDACLAHTSALLTIEMKEGRTKTNSTTKAAKADADAITQSGSTSYSKTRTAVQKWNLKYSKHLSPEAASILSQCMENQTRICETIGSMQPFCGPYVTGHPINCKNFKISIGYNACVGLPMYVQNQRLKVVGAVKWKCNNGAKDISCNPNLAQYKWRIGSGQQFTDIMEIKDFQRFVRKGGALVHLKFDKDFAGDLAYQLPAVTAATMSCVNSSK